MKYHSWDITAQLIEAIIIILQHQILREVIRSSLGIEETDMGKIR